MAERGTKRKCPSCGISYYDLNRNPITCPKCHTVYAPSLPVRGTPPRSRAPVPPPVEEVEVEETEEAEVEPAEDEFEEADELPADDETFVPPEDEEEERG